MNTEELQESYGRGWPKTKEHAEQMATHLSDTLEPTQNSYEMVKEFHETFGHPVADEPTAIEDDRTALRLALILEEALELADAMGFYAEDVKELVGVMLDRGPLVEANLIGIADALADLEYVTNGAALEHGVNLPEVVREVHRSNMTKLGPDGKPIYRKDGKILKGEGYEKPDIEAVLGL